MVLKIFIQVVVFYFILTGLVFILSDRSLFVPRPSSYTEQDIPELFKLSTADGKQITALYLPNPKAKYTILYSHGNADDLGRIYPLLQQFQHWGLNVASYDYQGYGTSPGKPSEIGCYNDINAVYDFLTKEQKIAPQNIILFGRSLGSGPTVDLATKQPIGGVILEGAFVSVYRVITYIPIFMFDKFNNIAKINEIKAPILFIHGEIDTVVPFWHAKKLYSAFQGTKQQYWIEKIGHNDIDYKSNAYKEPIMKFIESLN